MQQSFATRKEHWNYIYSIFPFIDLPFGVLSVVFSQHWIITLCMLPIFPVVATIILKQSQKKDLQPGPWIFSINGAVFMVFAYLAGYESPSWLMLINLTIGASFMFNKPRVGQIGMVCFALVTAGLFYWMGATLSYTLIIALSLIAFIVLFARTFDFLQMLQRRIATKNLELEQQKNEILASIGYAKRIQEAILPPERLVEERLPNAFVLYKPKDIVAGDFYWLHYLPQPKGWDVDGDTVLFAAADCTGHGVPGAMVSVVCNNALNRSVREFGLTDPGQILDKTNELVEETFEDSDKEVKDGMDISLCALNGKTLKYAGAHNPLWLIRNGEIIETKADKQPIGSFNEHKPYATHTFELQEGDHFYIFSDGFADQFGGPRGKKFKAKALRELLLSIQSESVGKQKQLVDDAFETWRGDLEQVDDVCMIGVRV